MVLATDAGAGLGFLKGQPVKPFGEQPRGQDGLSDKAIDCRAFNALHIEASLAGGGGIGTTWGVFVGVEGSNHEGGIYIPLPGSSWKKILTSAPSSFDVPVSTPWAKIRLYSLTESPAVYINVTATPFVAFAWPAIEANVRGAASSSVNNNAYLEVIAAPSNGRMLRFLGMVLTSTVGGKFGVSCATESVGQVSVAADTPLAMNVPGGLLPSSVAGAAGALQIMNLSGSTATVTVTMWAREEAP